MKALIIGASGLVGSNCLKHFTEQGWDVKGTYFSYAIPSLSYYNTLEQHDPANFDVHTWKPDIIVHCGALTHVDYCESHESESYTQTVQSTKNIIELANACGARIVYLSTDYVFDGREGPYKEDDVLNPISIYGKHKLEAEQAVLKNAAKSLVLRVTNIYGHEARGKNFVARIVQQIKDGVTLSLKLPYDQFATPTNALDIARAMYLLLRDNKTGIYHISGTDYMNRISLALRVLKHFPNTQYTLEPLSTASLNQPAARPLIGGFVTAKFAAEYPEFLFSNVDDFLTEPPATRAESIH